MNITVKSQTASSKKTFTAQVSTYGELKAVFDQQGIKYKDQKVVLKNTGAVLEFDSAVLPQEDLSVFIFPTQVKAGGSKKVVAAIQELADLFDQKIEELISAIEGISEDVATVAAAVEEECECEEPTAGDPLSDEDLNEMANFQ